VTDVPWDKIHSRIDGMISDDGNTDEKLLSVCKVLELYVPHYHWVGFYLTDPNRDRMLVLGPYVGDPTDHVEIPFGRGICGQAAERKETFIIQDVSKEDNYLSCSPFVRSEIVVPIMRDGSVLGEIDIDSHDTDPFTTDDRVQLEHIAKKVSSIL